MNLHKRAVIPFIALAIAVGSVEFSFAALLGNPLEHPQITYNSGGTTVYIASTNQLTIDGNPTAMQLSPGVFPFFIQEPKRILIQVEVDGNGALGVSGGDLVLSGTVNLALGFFSGDLLIGEVTAFGFQDVNLTDFFDFRVTITGGLLAFLYPSGELAISTDSENSNFTGSFQADFSGGSKGFLGGTPVIPALCELEVEKFCCIPPPPSANGGSDCLGKVISMEFQYTGSACSATTNQQEGKAKCTDGTALLADPVAVEFAGKGSDKLSATPDAGIFVGDPSILFTTSDNDFGSNTKINIFQDSDLLQALEIHTSCSKPLKVGDQFGSLLLTTLTSSEGGAVSLPDPSMPETTACVSAGDAVGSSCSGGLTEVVFAYTGSPCQMPLSNPQEGKASCTDGTGLVPVSIAFTGKGSDKLSASPATGIGLTDPPTLVTLSTSGSKFPSTTNIELQDDLDALSQTLKIHTSCSKPFRLGDAFGSFTVVSFTDVDGGLHILSDPEPPQPTSECTVFSAPPEPHCTTKLEGLTFSYLGGNCLETTNLQEGKVICTDTVSGPPAGLPNPTEPVQIVVSGTGKDAGKIFLDTGPGVQFGDTVTARASVGGKRTFGSGSLAQIFDANGILLQDIEFHTSCSKPLNLGDRFGALEVAALDLENVGPISPGRVVEYQYMITNPTASEVTGVIVDDDQLGEIARDLSIPSGETLTLFETATIFSDTTNVVMVSGDQGTLACIAPTASAVVTVVDPPMSPDSCANSKPKQLVFEYTGLPCSATTNTQEGRFSCSEPNPLMGTSPIQIVITKDLADVTASPSMQVVTTTSEVTFTASGAKLKAETQFDIVQDGTVMQSLNIHTSCSKPLNVGDQFGSMKLVEFIAEQ